MKKSLQLFMMVLCCTFVSNVSLKAQDDCCGMGSVLSSVLQSGIYGGYGFQQYSATGLDLSVNATQGLEDFNEFGFAHGWRVGANVIGVRHDDVLFSLKLHYQSVGETQEATEEVLQQIIKREVELKLNSWSLGMSLSYILSSHFDYRVFDLLMTFNSTELTYKEGTDKNTYKSEGSNIGFSFDTGIVFYPAPPYVSIEILGGYSFFSIEEVKDENDQVLTTTEDFIDGGGFFAVAVLTIGIPFN